MSNKNIEEGPVDFGTAVDLMKEGYMMCRSGWNGKGLFVFMQVPSLIQPEVIHKMTSLPNAVKIELGLRNLPLSYSNQFAIVDKGSKINGWTPSPSDATAQDWVKFDNRVMHG